MTHLTHLCSRTSLPLRLSARHLALLANHHKPLHTHQQPRNSLLTHHHTLSGVTHRPFSSPARHQMEGTCLCKAIALKITDERLRDEKGQRLGHLCHCSNCRKVAGGLFGANLIVEEDAVEWVRGRDIVKIYEDRDTLSGKPVYRHFCPDCGVPIMSVAESIKGKVILKLGIYPKLPEPAWESFAAERQSWEKPYEGCVQYKTKSFGDKMEGSP